MAAGRAHFQAIDLAGDLPGLLLEARRLAALAPGVHGRRRSGVGEAFWQFRDHRPEDGARLVDWRRSARGERLFVREREREAAQTAQIWLDADAGFAWSAEPDAWPQKRTRGLVMATALAILLARGGERIGVVGGETHAGPRAPERLALALAEPVERPFAVSPRGLVLLVSDFYAPLDDTRDRLAACLAAGARAALLSVCDPSEEDFPFQGRTRFEPVGGAGKPVTFGRAEGARDAYRARLAAHRAGVADLAAAADAPLILHRTDHAPGPAFAALTAAVAEGAA
jgi:uncharacterized protein (DUF58 family)